MIIYVVMSGCFWFFWVFFFFKQKTAYEGRFSDWSSDVCSSDLGGIDVLAGLQDALGEPRDRHADVGGPALGARLHREVGEVGGVARLPQLGAVLLAGRPGEVGAAVVPGDLADQRGLLPGAGPGAVALGERQEERRVGEEEVRE